MSPFNSKLSDGPPESNNIRSYPDLLEDFSLHDVIVRDGKRHFLGDAHESTQTDVTSVSRQGSETRTVKSVCYLTNRFQNKIRFLRRKL